MLGLGGSVGTPTDGIEAEVLVVNSFEDLREKQRVRGRVVLFNAPFTDYGATVVFRVRGAIEAAKVGGWQASFDRWAHFPCKRRIPE